MLLPPLLLPVVLAGLASCASTAEPQRSGGGSYLDSWVGAREFELVRAWGEPSTVSVADGRRVLVYEKRVQIQVPGTPTISGDFGPVGGMPPMTVAMTCTTTFEVVDGVVSSAAAKGNGCSNRRAAPPLR